jgi:hypothetical protein
MEYAYKANMFMLCSYIDVMAVRFLTIAAKGKEYNWFALDKNWMISAVRSASLNIYIGK